MNYLNIDSEIEKLNLEWQEYDFGDTLYAKVPVEVWTQQTNIDQDCETEKYKITFSRDGYVSIFKETERVSTVEKIVRSFAKMYSLFKKESDFTANKKKARDRSVVDADL